MSKDKVNLLPEKERRESDDALNKAGEQSSEKEISLSSPKEQEQSKPEKKHFWTRDKKNKKKEQEPGHSKNKPLVKREKSIAKTTSSGAELFSDIGESHFWEKKKEAPKPPTKHSDKKKEEDKGHNSAHEISFISSFSEELESNQKKEPKKRKPKKKEKKKKEHPQKTEKKKEDHVVTPPELHFDVKEKADAHSGKQEQPKKDSSFHEPESDSSSSGPRVNLVPEYAIEQDTSRQWFLISSVLIFVVAIWIIIIGWTVSAVNNAETEYANKQSELDNLNALIAQSKDRKDAAESLQKQFQSIDSLIDNHIYWVPFLEKLSELTIPDVYYAGIVANKSGEVTLQAIAKNYEAAARQIRALEKAPTVIDSVRITEAKVENQPGATLPVPIIRFDIQLELVPDILFLSSPDQE